MCGICGVFSKSRDDIQNLQASALRMNDTQRHRGPDYQNTYTSETHKVVLGHSRLSIIDTSPNANQPMISPCGNYCLAFNGEIYNYRELKSKLQNEGQIFQSSSDTEVLLYALVRWGVEPTLKLLKGMFAFSFFVESSGDLYLARDPIGEKPLYYYHSEDHFVFASELKAIMQSGLLKAATINKEALAQYLRYGYISAPNSILETCHSLPPGTLLHLQTKSNSKELRRYEPQPNERLRTSRFTGNYTDAVTELDLTLNEAIDRQSIADVALGSFLSGGIDSTLVTAVLQSQKNLPIETFTIGFDIPQFNEAPYAKQISNYLGTTHNEIILTEDILRSTIDHCIKTFDEPFADASALPSILINSFAKEKVKVSLSGDGGDELFAGYNRYTESEIRYKQMQKMPNILKRAMTETHRKVKTSVIDRTYRAAFKTLGRKTEANVGLKVQKLSEAVNCQDLSQYYTFLCSFWDNPRSIIKSESSDGIIDFPLQGDDSSFIEAAMNWDVTYYLPGDNLTKADRSSMAAGLEVRVPLLDKEVRNFSATLPMDFKAQGRDKKIILKDALNKYVPKRFTDRPKMGFSVPISTWINTSLAEEIDHYLGKDFVTRQQIFIYEAIAEVLQAHRSGYRDHGNKIWSLYMFQRWYEEHFCKIRTSC